MAHSYQHFLFADLYSVQFHYVIEGFPVFLLVPLSYFAIIHMIVIKKPITGQMFIMSQICTLNLNLWPAGNYSMSLHNNFTSNKGSQYCSYKLYDEFQFLNMKFYFNFVALISSRILLTTGLIKPYQTTQINMKYNPGHLIVY